MFWLSQWSTSPVSSVRYCHLALTSKPQTRIQHEMVPYFAAAGERSRCFAWHVEAIHSSKQYMLVHFPVHGEINLVSKIFRVDVHGVHLIVARNLSRGELGQVKVEIKQ